MAYEWIACIKCKSYDKVELKGRSSQRKTFICKECREKTDTLEITCQKCGSGFVGIEKYREHKCCETKKKITIAVMVGPFRKSVRAFEKTVNGFQASDIRLLFRGIDSEIPFTKMAKEKGMEVAVCKYDASERARDYMMISECDFCLCFPEKRDYKRTTQNRLARKLGDHEFICIVFPDEEKKSEEKGKSDKEQAKQSNK